MTALSSDQKRRKISDVTIWNLRWLWIETDYLTFPDGTDINTILYYDTKMRSTSTAVQEQIKNIFGKLFWEKWEDPRTNFLCWSIYIKPDKSGVATIPRMGDYVVKVEAPKDSYLRIRSSQEKFSVDGSFPLHPYYDILVHVPDTEEGTIKITYILVTQKMREMIYKNPSPFLF